MTRSPRILTTTSNATANSAVPPAEALVANVESDFVVILAALLCALICVLGLIAVARCAWLRRATGVSLPTFTRTAANRGIKKKVLQSLPKFTYTASNPNTKPDHNSNTSPNPNPDNKYTTECAICLGEYVEGDEIRVLPQCGHTFHVGCIDTWLGTHSSCPSCRQILVVARCHKCGHFPAAAGGGGGGETKKEENNCGEGNSNSNNGGFLP